MRRTFQAGGAVALACVLAGAMSSCMNPEVETKQWDQIQTVEQNLNDLRSNIAELESTIDSLTHIVARQDSALRVIVDFTGAYVPAYRSGR